MGVAAGSEHGLDNVVKRAESRAGKFTISGRYHRMPRKLEDDYIILKKNILGSGYNGKVFEARGRTGGGTYAVKGFKLVGVPREKREELEAECEIFLAMDHPHVARLVDVYESPEQLALVMECMSGGELFGRVQKLKRFTEQAAADAARQMLLAVNYIHGIGVVHRDIKLENFLFEKPESDFLKLIDFGFSKIWKPNTTMRLSCGTLAYVAPEVLDQNYTSQCDLWSLGVTVFILLFGYMPFSGNEDKQISDIKNGRYTVKPAKWDSVSGVAQDFVKKLLVVKPTSRMTAEDALKHPFIVNREQLTTEVNNDIVNALVDFGNASAFRRACLSMMAWSLTNEERSKVREAFMQLDEDKTGVIKIGELKKVLENKCHIHDEDATRIFQALDTTQSEEIHYSEFLAAMVSTRIALHDDLLLAAFKRFDCDNSGKITVDNLREVLGETFSGAAVESIMKEADQTGSGDISYEEWIQYLRANAGDERHREMAAQLIDHRLSNSPHNEKTIAVKSSKKMSAMGAKEQMCCCIN